MVTFNPYDLSHIACLTEWFNDRRSSGHRPFPFLSLATVNSTTKPTIASGLLKADTPSEGDVKKSEGEGLG